MILAIPSSTTFLVARQPYMHPIEAVNNRGSRFAFHYECSCQEYSAVRQTLIQTNLLQG